MSKATTTVKTAPVTTISHKQVKMLRLATKTLHVELSLPEAPINDAHEEEAKAIVKGWTDGGWAPKTGNPGDIEEAIAGRLAMATALGEAGVTRKQVNDAIGYWKAVKNRRDVSPNRKADGFMTRLGVEGSFAPPASEATTVALSLPEAPQQLGGGAAFGQQPMAFGRMAASPAMPGQVSQTAIDVAANLAARGMGPEQINNALAGLRAAGML